jgi:capsid protein
MPNKRKAVIQPRKIQAAAKPIKTPGIKRNYYGGQNTLIASATQTPDRKRVLPMDRDIHRNVSSMGRRTMLSLGRWMFWNIPEIKGAILEQANLATSTFIPQYSGRNRAWGERAEAWLKEWHKIMDVAGWPFDYQTYVKFLVVKPLVDGDMATILTETDSGYPQIQTIGAHRIDSVEHGQLESGEFAGYTIIDGVICDDLNRVAALRIKTDGEAGTAVFQDVSSRDAFLTYDPEDIDQKRGFSSLAAAAFNLQDRDESRKFELLAQKAFASKTLIETNEEGESNAAEDLIRAGAENSDGEKIELDRELLDGGTITYLKARSGSSIDAFAWDRPSANSQEFQERTLRDAFRGSEWDVLFSIDPKGTGGAAMRVVVEKINATLHKRRRLVEKACRRVDGYAISKAIKLGLLPKDEDWWRWEYQGPGEISADRKYDSEIDIEEIAQGLGTAKNAIARRGGFYDDVRMQLKQEAGDRLNDAAELAKAHGITIQEALNVLRPPARTTASVSTSNQPAPAPNNSPA